MERRNRDRLNMNAFCRIAPAANSRRTSWKTIENISGAGMLLVWSRGESEARPPRTGDRYTVEVQLPLTRRLANGLCSSRPGWFASSNPAES